jgi:hypothetical protein
MNRDENHCEIFGLPASRMGGSERDCGVKQRPVTAPGTAWDGTLPSRHGATLDSLSCWLCGAVLHTECDIATHQQYANEQFECSVCGAPADEVCLPECPAANTLLDVCITVKNL